MAFKIIVICATLAIANAGFLGAPAAVSYSAAPAVSTVSYASPLVSYGTPTITSQSDNIIRSYGNLGQVSTQTKTIDTPFSSVRKSDVRVSNPGLKIAAAPAYAYAAAPAVAYQAAPAYAHAPAYLPAPAVAHAPAAGVAYSAAPAVAHVSFNGLGYNYGW